VTLCGQGPNTEFLVSESLSRHWQLSTFFCAYVVCVGGVLTMSDRVLTTLYKKKIIRSKTGGPEPPWPVAPVRKTRVSRC